MQGLRQDARPGVDRAVIRPAGGRRATRSSVQSSAGWELPPPVATGLIVGAPGDGVGGPCHPKIATTREAGAADALWLRFRPVLRPDPRRFPQRSDARRGPAAAVYAGGRQPSFAPRRSAGDRRRHGAQGSETQSTGGFLAGPGSRSPSAPALRLHPLWAPPGSSVRWSGTGRCCPTPRTGSSWGPSCSRACGGARSAGRRLAAMPVRAMHDNAHVRSAYAAAGVDTSAADRGVGALVEVLRGIDPGGARWRWHSPAITPA